MTDDSSREQYDIEHRERVVEEILGDVDEWTASEEGPDGPWYYKSLTIRRVHNTLHVFDVDGELARMVSVDSLDPSDEMTDDLLHLLEDINSKTMAEL